MNESYAVIGRESFEMALSTLASGVAGFVPRLVIALFAFIVLWIVAVMLGKLIEQVVKSLKVDSLLEGLGASEPLSRAGYKLNIGAFLGGLVRWFFIILAILVAVDILNLTAVSDFLSEVVLNYLPNVIVAAVILIVAALLSDFAQKLVRGSAQAINMPAANLAGSVAKWAIWVFAIVVALDQLQVAPQIARFFEIVITAVLAMLALAGGLAFGLGGKEAASDYIDKMRRQAKG